MVVGGFSALYALASASPLLSSRDQFVSAFREDAQRLVAGVSDQAKRAELEQLLAREAEVIYDRRGVALPLLAMEAILSILLFLGCGGALRLSAWGASVWTFTAQASIPYQLLDAAYGMVTARDLSLGSPMAPVLVAKCLIAIGYFAGCLMYLRRAEVKRLWKTDNP